MGNKTIVAGWLLLSAIIIGTLLFLIGPQTLAISVAGVSIVFSAILLKYIQVYAEWHEGKISIAESIKQIRIDMIRLEELGSEGVGNG